MFTGIVDHTADVVSVERREKGLSCRIKTSFTDCSLGDSIAINGVCLTITGIEGSTFSFDVSEETLSCTTLDTIQVGQPVHVEAALRIGDRLGGHWVTGHVDSTACVNAIEQSGDYLAVTFTIAHQYARYLVEKGSVALDGVSLTINEIGADFFSVMLVPHTLSVTRFDSLAVGKELNIEYDYLLKWAARDSTLSAWEGKK